MELLRQLDKTSHSTHFDCVTISIHALRCRLYTVSRFGSRKGCSVLIRNILPSPNLIFQIFLWNDLPDEIHFRLKVFAYRHCALSHYAHVYVLMCLRTRPCSHTYVGKQRGAFGRIFVSITAYSGADVHRCVADVHRCVACYSPPGVANCIQQIRRQVSVDAS